MLPKNLCTLDMMNTAQCDVNRSQRAVTLVNFLGRDRETCQGDPALNCVDRRVRPKNRLDCARSLFLCDKTKENFCKATFCATNEVLNHGYQAVLFNRFQQLGGTIFTQVVVHLSPYVPRPFCYIARPSLIFIFFGLSRSLLACVRWRKDNRGLKWFLLARKLNSKSLTSPPVKTWSRRCAISLVTPRLCHHRSSTTTRTVE